jgi:hypothetical protein
VRMIFSRIAALKRMLQLPGVVVGLHRERRVISTGPRQQDPMRTVTVILPEIEVGGNEIILLRRCTPGCLKRQTRALTPPSAAPGLQYEQPWRVLPIVR